MLSGERQRTFRADDMLDGVDYYGPGGHVLRQPADFKAAGAWYHFTHQRDVWPERWRVEGYVWKGDKLARTYVKEGVGGEPPAGAFP
jgi:hypothetical protein